MKTLEAALSIETHTREYQIKFLPDEALAFAADLPALGKAKRDSVTALIRSINAAMPRPAIRGIKRSTEVHSFRIGRENGCRVVVLELFRGSIAPRFDWTSLTDRLERLGRISGCFVGLDDDESVQRFTFLWDR